MHAGVPRIAFTVLLCLPELLSGQECLDPMGRPRLDRSRPVPSKAEIVAAWQKRQDIIRTAHFVWSEQQTMPKGWFPNPLYPERERTLVPALGRDRSYTVSKSLTVDGRMMRYSFELDRPEEPDSGRAFAPGVATSDLGAGRRYTYLSVFDGERGRVQVSAPSGSPPPVTLEERSNVDAQNLDTRPVLLAIRPLDPVLGLRLIDRARTNEVRAFWYCDSRSTMILEEHRDPTGWKTLVWIDPERGFLIRHLAIGFEQKQMARIDIEHVEDPRWGWIPSEWRVTEMLADGSKRWLTAAKVIRYSINEPVAIWERQP